MPINLVVFKGSYLFETMGYLIFGSASRLDAFKKANVVDTLQRGVEDSKLSECASGFNQKSGFHGYLQQAMFGGKKRAHSYHD